jgi:hypothetical protein
MGCVPHNYVIYLLKKLQSFIDFNFFLSHFCSSYHSSFSSTFPPFLKRKRTVFVIDFGKLKLVTLQICLEGFDDIKMVTDATGHLLVFTFSYSK